MNETTQDKKIIMYGTPYCPMVAPVKGIFRRANVEYDYIDIAGDPEGKEIVRGINNGYESVPTIVFPDGSTLTEPSSQEVEKKLHTMGYETSRLKPWDALRENPFYTLLGLGGIAYGIFDENIVFIMMGLGMLAFTFMMSYARR